MSKIAERITGLNSQELFESDFPSINSVKDVCYPAGAEVRQSVRAYTGLLIGPGDLNEVRKQLRNNTPKALRLPKK